MTDWIPIDDPLPGHRRVGHGPSLVLLHGFTQTGLSWTPVTDDLDPDFELYAPDAPGHGRSTSLRFGIDEYADRLAASLPPSTYVGYSMGGRTALRVALDHPDRVRALVLVGATPGIEESDDRAARRDADEVLARKILGSSLDEFLTEWLTQSLFSTLPRSSWNLDDRRRNDVAGLAFSLRSAGTGTQESVWSRLSELRCPTVLVTGGLDTKFTAIAERMAPMIAGPVEHVVVDGHGHAVHLENPERVAALIERAVVRLD